MKNIHPIYDRMASRAEREQLIRQCGVTLWFTGLSGSGKSTLALALEQQLREDGYLCYLLDGDNLRSGLNDDLDFSREQRRENIRRTAEVCRMFVDAGIVVLATMVSPTEELRDVARRIISRDDFVEIYVSTPLCECERRDVKGLYAKARRGEIEDFTGIDAPFEPPFSPHLTIDTTERSVKECVEEIMQFVRSKVEYKPICYAM